MAVKLNDEDDTGGHNLVDDSLYTWLFTAST